MFQQIQPVEFKVLVLPDEVEDRSAGGMYLPDSVRERQQYAMDRGEILSIGEGFFSDLPGPKPMVGDKILYNKYAGSTFDMMIKGKRRTVRILNDKDVVAIVKEEKKNG